MSQLVTIPSPEEFDAAVRGMIETGYAVIRFPISELVPKIVEGMKRLIASPDASSWQLTVERPGADGTPDDGLIRRSRAMKRKPDEASADKPVDNKWTYMYRPSLEHELRTRGFGDSVERHRQLLDDSQAYYLISDAYCDQLMLAMDRRFPGGKFAERHRTAIKHNMDALRVLLYDLSSSEEELIGKDHTDKDFATFATNENYPAFRRKGERTPTPIKPGYAILFGGDKAERDTNGVIKALGHGALNQVPPEFIGVQRHSLIRFTHTP